MNTFTPFMNFLHDASSEHKTTMNYTRPLLLKYGIDHKLNNKDSLNNHETTTQYTRIIIKHEP